MNDPEKTKRRRPGRLGDGLHAGQHRRARDVKQGDYFSDTIGPYDMWAIEYGYKPLSGGTEGEVAELKKIASRAASRRWPTPPTKTPAASTPIRCRTASTWASDPIDYAKERAKLIGELWPGMVDRVTEDGDGYRAARQAFGVLLGNYGRAVYFASRYVGGMYVNRDHKGDANGQAAVRGRAGRQAARSARPARRASLQRQAVQFPPELYNHLASTRWKHWGSDVPLRSDYPVHDVIAMWQDRILSQLLSSLTLTGCTTPS